MFDIKKNNDNVQPVDYKNLYDQSILILNLKTRAYHGLRIAGVDTIRDLCNLTKGELKTMKNIGKVSISEIEIKLKELGLELHDGSI